MPESKRLRAGESGIRTLDVDKGNHYRQCLVQNAWGKKNTDVIDKPLTAVRIKKEYQSTKQHTTSFDGLKSETRQLRMSIFS